MNRYFILILILFCSSILFSQTNTGSPYSINELGEINFSGNVSNLSMGGIDVKIDSIEVNLNNPASYAKLKTSNYLVGTFLKTSNISNSISNENISSANINYIAVAIPTKKFGFGFGVLPYSSTGFNLQTSEEYNNANSIDTRLYAANGGINRVFLSIGFPLTEFLSLGLTSNYNFGKFNYESFDLYEGVNYGIYSNSSSEISGFNYQLSSNIDIPINRDLKFNIMLSYSPSSILNSANTRDLYTSTTNLINPNSLGDFVEVNLEQRGLKNTELRVPKKYTYGIGLGNSKKWFIGAQVEKKFSSNFKNEFLNINNVSYRDAESISIGASYIPEYSSLTSFWNRVVYRFGVKNERKSIIVNNLPINQFSLNLGVGIPLAGLSKANVGIEFGQIGEENNINVKENYFSLRLGLSLNDVWFIRRKYN
jgi:hypothetical protein